MEKFSLRVMRRGCLPWVDNDNSAVVTKANTVPSTLLPVEDLWYVLLFCDEAHAPVWDVTLHSRIRKAFEVKSDDQSGVIAGFSAAVCRRNYVQRAAFNQLLPEEAALARNMKPLLDFPCIKDNDFEGDGLRINSDVSVSFPTHEFTSIKWLDSNGRIQNEHTDAFVHEDMMAFSGESCYGMVVQFTMPSRIPEVNAMITIILPTMQGEEGIAVVLGQILHDPECLRLEPRNVRLTIPAVSIERTYDDITSIFSEREIGAHLLEQKKSIYVYNGKIPSYNMFSILANPKPPQTKTAGFSDMNRVDMVLNHPFYITIHANQHLIYSALIRNVK